MQHKRLKQDDWLHGGSFFKIINPFIMETGLLRIPRKFIARYGKDLPNEVVLQVPSGMVWRIKIRKVDGYVCLEGGWREFMEYHSVCVGHFLVFVYDRKSQFFVLVFNMTGTEIDYLSCSDKIRQTNHVKDALEPLIEGRSCDHLEDRLYAKRASSRRGVKLEESDRVILTPLTFNSSYPFFKVNVTPSFVNCRCMIMPIKFYNTYFPGTSGSLTLQSSNGRKKWLVRFSAHSTVRMFGPGLAAFILESNIKVGDICYFELIDKKSGVLKANIFPNNPKHLDHVQNPLVSATEDRIGQRNAQKDDSVSAEDLSGHMTARRPMKTENTDRVIKASTAFKSNHPFFNVIMKSSNLEEGTTIVPIRFFRIHLPEGMDKLTLICSNGRNKWPVRCSIYGDAMRMSGLTSFIFENEIKVGDVCFFELIDRMNGVLKTSIISGADDSSFLQGSNHPFFKVNVTPSYFQMRYMPVPQRFYKTFLQRLDLSKLQILNGSQKWGVSLSKAGRGMRLRTLTAFILESNIKIGDICYFELINRDESILKATVSSRK